MKRSKEYKISVGLFSISIVLYCVSMITGLIPELSFAIDKICMYVSFSVFCMGLVFMMKNDEKNNNNGK